MRLRLLTFIHSSLDRETKCDSITCVVIPLYIIYGSPNHLCVLYDLARVLEQREQVLKSTPAKLHHLKVPQVNWLQYLRSFILIAAFYTKLSTLELVQV